MEHPDTFECVSAVCAEASAEVWRSNATSVLLALVSHMGRFRICFFGFAGRMRSGLVPYRLAARLGIHSLQHLQ